MDEIAPVGARRLDTLQRPVVRAALSLVGVVAAVVAVLLAPKAGPGSTVALVLVPLLAIAAVACVARALVPDSVERPASRATNLLADAGVGLALVTPLLAGNGDAFWQQWVVVGLGGGALTLAALSVAARVSLPGTPWGVLEPVRRSNVVAARSAAALGLVTLLAFPAVVDRWPGTSYTLPLGLLVPFVLAQVLAVAATVARRWDLGVSVAVGILLALLYPVTLFAFVSGVSVLLALPWLWLVVSLRSARRSEWAAGRYEPWSHARRARVALLAALPLGVVLSAVSASLIAEASSVAGAPWSWRLPILAATFTAVVGMVAWIGVLQERWSLVFAAVVLVCLPWGLVLLFPLVGFLVAFPLLPWIPLFVVSLSPPPRETSALVDAVGVPAHVGG